jgi:hypothetical protein
MKKHYSLFFVITAAVLFIAGFIFLNEDPQGSKTYSAGDNSQVQIQNPVPTFTPPIYTDDLDGANDTTALKNRGYKVWYRGTGPQGLTATWFQGNSTVFPAFNGPATGYVAANYNAVTGTNTIDSWLVLPYISGGLQAGDSLYFYSRAPTGSTYPDSIKVMASASDSVPEGTWVELGRFKVNILGMWERKGFRTTVGGTHSRFAIRYNVINGGPSGTNSDFIGIDAIQVVRNLIGITPNSNELPGAYNLSQNYPNPFNPTTVFSFSIPKAGNVKIVVYDAMGKEAALLVNEHKNAGTYNVDFNASNLASGVYLYRIEAGNYTDTKKMLLIK